MPKVRFTADEKARAVRRHLQDGVPISAICSEMSIPPNFFHIWQKQLFAGAAPVFENRGKAEQRQHERKVAGATRLQGSQGKTSHIDSWKQKKFCAE